jgi:sarcosine oxidase, subunit alpha
MILRAEKGYIVIGKDTDGTTMPHDLGVTGPRDSRADEYIGKRSLFMPVATDPRRKQLVGLSVAAGDAPLPTGAHVTAGAGRTRRSQGYVTSSTRSPTLGRPVALGLVEAGLSRMGDWFRLYLLGAVGRATTTNPVALDP